MCIREQDPLKQGLKLVEPNPLRAPPTYSRARSTKTRIETRQTAAQATRQMYSRARSTKTRIETTFGGPRNTGKNEFESKIH